MQSGEQRKESNVALPCSKFEHIGTLVHATMMAMSDGLAGLEVLYTQNGDL